MTIPTNTQSIEPSFVFHLPTIINNDTSLLLGFIVGLLCVILDIKILSHYLIAMKEWVIDKTQKYLTLMLPVFIAGFSLKMSYEGILGTILSNNKQIILLIFSATLIYILIWLIVLTSASSQKIKSYSKNMLPAIATSFATMSGVAAMPLSIKSAEKNSINQDNNIANIIIPSTVNIHLIGDGIFIPLMAFAIINSFNVELPTLTTFLIFSLHYTKNKLSVAGIPAGGIVVIVPILEQYMGFDPRCLL